MLTSAQTAGFGADGHRTRGLFSVSNLIETPEKEDLENCPESTRRWTGGEVSVAHR